MEAFALQVACTVQLELMACNAHPQLLTAWGCPHSPAALQLWTRCTPGWRRRRSSGASCTAAQPPPLHIWRCVGQEGVQGRGSPVCEEIVCSRQLLVLPARLPSPLAAMHSS